MWLTKLKPGHKPRYKETEKKPYIFMKLKLTQETGLTGIFELLLVEVSLTSPKKKYTRRHIGL